ncbi:MAG TPA: hypothetical protein PKV74_06890 [Syntrophales bacterium]|nr:hypothetical protein [Syntrophales bacterium]
MKMMLHSLSPLLYTGGEGAASGEMLAGKYTGVISINHFHPSRVPPRHENLYENVGKCPIIFMLRCARARNDGWSENKCRRAGKKLPAGPESSPAAAGRINGRRQRPLDLFVELF